MRFHFGHSQSGGVLVPHPSYLVVLDPHSTADQTYIEPSIEPIARSESSGMKHRKQQPQPEASRPVNPADEDEEAPPVSVKSMQEESHPELVRPKHRQFFRLGRHRNRSSAANTDEHKSLSPPPSGRRRRSPSNKARLMGLRRPTMKRSVSLPHDLKVASTETVVSVGESCPPCSHSERSIPKHRRHVTFSCVQIREYSRILGDHPCCPSGPPLALGWVAEREDSFVLDEYERKRDPVRRSHEDFRLGCQDRREILENLVISPTSSDSEGEAVSSNSGTCCMYSRAEIRKAERRLNRERAENHRAMRKMNHKFFKPVIDDTTALDNAKPQDEVQDKEPLHEQN